MKELETCIYYQKKEEAFYWTGELICSGYILELWNLFLYVMCKYIHINNPRLPLYIDKKFNEFKDILLNMKKTHNLIFVNGNNYSKVNKYNLPDALEVSFAREDLNLTSSILTKSDLEILTGGGNSVRYPKYELVWA